MQYTTLGHTGLVVSRLAFGAMTFGTGELVPGVGNNMGKRRHEVVIAFPHPAKMRSRHFSGEKLQHD